MRCEKAMAGGRLTYGSRGRKSFVRSAYAATIITMLAVSITKLQGEFTSSPRCKEHHTIGSPCRIFARRDNNGIIDAQM